MTLARPAAILFDLDGTLLDTAPDLAAALNHARALEGLAPLPLHTLRPYASHGARGLLACGFGEEQPNEDHERRRQALLDHYHANLAVGTSLFGGVAELLEELAIRKIPWAIVTNKPGWLTAPLLVHFAELASAGCVVSGDTLKVAKPHPQPLLHACAALGVEAKNCWYVGDARRDLEAGRAAGMKAVLAEYGYLTAEEPEADWPIDLKISQPLELVALLS